VSETKDTISKLKRTNTFFIVLCFLFAALMIFSAFVNVSKGLTITFVTMMAVTGGVSMGISLSTDQFKEKK